MNAEKKKQQTCLLVFLLTVITFITSAVADSGFPIGVRLYKNSAVPNECSCEIKLAQLKMSTLRQHQALFSAPIAAKSVVILCGA